MTDDISAISGLQGLDPSLTAREQPKEASKEIGADEFLQLLVTQLQNQDPLDPVKNEDFSVSLAQFNQLEQLVSINEKIGGDAGSSGTGLLASYLGHEVLFGDSTVSLTGGTPANVSFFQGVDSIGGTLDLLDGEGNVAGTIPLGPGSKGTTRVAIDEAGVAPGDYQLRVTLNGTDGIARNPEAHQSGVVNGFVPGPTPSLLVDGQEVDPSLVRQVQVI